MGYGPITVLIHEVWYCWGRTTAINPKSFLILQESNSRLIHEQPVSTFTPQFLRFRYIRRARPHTHIRMHMYTYTRVKLLNLRGSLQSNRIFRFCDIDYILKTITKHCIYRMTGQPISLFSNFQILSDLRFFTVSHERAHSDHSNHPHLNKELHPRYFRYECYYD